MRTKRLEVVLLQQPQPHLPQSLQHDLAPTKVWTIPAVSRRTNASLSVTLRLPLYLLGGSLHHALAAATGPLRPAPVWDVAAGEVVSGGSVCRYSLSEETQSPADADAPSALSGSRRLTAVEAAAVRDAVAAAPIGSGPNDPASCLPEVSRGDEVVVVTLETDAGSRELFVRYSGCDHNGVDDGTTHRILTPEIAASVFDASLLPTEWSGVLDAVFTPLWDTQRS